MKTPFVIVMLLAVKYGEALTKNFDHTKFETQELKYVGVADGVAYFRDLSEHIDWHSAAEICRSSGLQLAIINTENQMQMLRWAVHPELPDTLYWTSGRDAHNLRQFSWNSTNTAVPEFIAKDGINNWVGPTNFQTCLTIYKQGNRVTVGMFHCLSGQYTLCST